jgi:hypothetical protein
MEPGGVFGEGAQSASRASTRFGLPMRTLESAFQPSKA